MFQYTVTIMTSESGVRSITRTTVKASDEPAMVSLLLDYLSFQGLSYLGHIILSVEAIGEKPLP